jgi:hypothetical protein
MIRDKIYLDGGELYFVELFNGIASDSASSRKSPTKREFNLKNSDLISPGRSCTPGAILYRPEAAVYRPPNPVA